ncbi:hypothetical protein F6X53_14730 [Methylobacterium soli]|uniref:Uncharacterized protein n=2 Tax=Methylobacterium soli TaxID=553447 RepID=A0A6L3T4V8_9HYPH|nr:hypothetical protein F6X53_14730 [Methylobacterium soli]GJE45885.1 hypothetical protein AEGHOMDF_5085 [Methylobacterium soli]
MGRSERRGLARLMLRYPERREAFRRKAADDPYFLELCDAYEATCEAAEYWARSSEPFAPERTCEYRRLATDVEEDILRKVV